MDKIENVGTIPQKYVYFSVDRLQWDSFSVKRHLICRKVRELLTFIIWTFYALVCPCMVKCISLHTIVMFIKSFIQTQLVLFYFMQQDGWTLLLYFNRKGNIYLALSAYTNNRIDFNNQSNAKSLLIIYIKLLLSIWCVYTFSSLQKENNMSLCLLSKNW